MTVTRLDEITPPVLISQEDVQANLIRLNSIKVDLQNYNEESKAALSNIIENEILVENKIKDVFNPLYPFFNLSVSVSKKASELSNQLGIFATFFKENAKFIGSTKYKEYKAHVQTILTMFADLEKLKLKQDKLHQDIQPYLEYLDAANNIFEESDKTLALINQKMKLLGGIANLDTSINNRKENINNLQIGIEQRNVRIDELETSISGRKKKVSKLEAGIEERNKYIKDLEASIDKDYEIIGQCIERGFEEMRTGKQLPLKPDSSMREEVLKKKPQPISVTNEDKNETAHAKKHSTSSSSKTMGKKKKSSHSTRNSIIAPSISFESLVNASKNYNDNRLSLSHKYKAVVDTYSILTSNFNLYSEKVKTINSTYEKVETKITELREAKIIEGRRQNEFLPPPDTSTQRIQNQPHSQSNKIVAVKV